MAFLTWMTVAKTIAKLPQGVESSWHCFGIGCLFLKITNQQASHHDPAGPQEWNCQKWSPEACGSILTLLHSSCISLFSVCVHSNRSTGRTRIMSRTHFWASGLWLLCECFGWTRYHISAHQPFVSKATCTTMAGACWLYRMQGPHCPHSMSPSCMSWVITRRVQFTISIALIQ